MWLTCATQTAPTCVLNTGFIEKPTRRFIRQMTSNGYCKRKSDSQCCMIDAKENFADSSCSAWNSSQSFQQTVWLSEKMTAQVKSIFSPEWINWEILLLCLNIATAQRFTGQREQYRVSNFSMIRNTCALSISCLAIGEHPTIDDEDDGNVLSVHRSSVSNEVWWTAH